MGTPLCRRPSRGILGSMIWRQKRRQALSRGGWESYRTSQQGTENLSTQGFSSTDHQVEEGQARDPLHLKIQISTVPPVHCPTLSPASFKQSSG